ncbi:hypothetical protein HDV05_005794 [Chytridiales sp. JEL 0842]|nr:hypothetical protein HDV05_005794 [Chytridiales sp. JEL 0842]
MTRGAGVRTAHVQRKNQRSMHPPFNIASPSPKSKPALVSINSLQRRFTLPNKNSKPASQSTSIIESPLKEAKLFKFRTEDDVLTERNNHYGSSSQSPRNKKRKDDLPSMPNQS